MDKNNIKSELKVYIRKEIIKNDEYPIMDDEPLITSGLIDSFNLAQMAIFIENKFNVYIPDTDLTIENMDTINDITIRVMKENHDE